MNPAHDYLVTTAMLRKRDAEDSLQNAIGWTIAVHHDSTPHAFVLQGFWADWQDAYLAALEKERSMNMEDEDDPGCWVARVEPIMPGERAA